MNEETRSGPLSGVKVVELGLWIAAPAAAGIMADWGADVVKVEGKLGDPARNAMASILGIKDHRSPPFDVDNRGKKSVVLDLREHDDLTAFKGLLGDADVFVTNMRPAALEKLSISPDDLRVEFPELVIAQITGYGATGPDANRPGYDSGGFWAYSGLAHQFSGETGNPPLLIGGFGDHLTGLALLSGINAALYKKSQTGQGSIVETSLLRLGIYAASMDYSLKMNLGFEQHPMRRQAASPALVNNYRTSDDRSLWLLCVEEGRHWPVVLEALGLQSLLDDDRFASTRDRYHNRIELIEILDARFAELSLQEWRLILDSHEIWWCAANNLDEVLASAQAAAVGAFTAIPNDPEGWRTVASPIDFDRQPTRPSGPTPKLGENNDEILNS